MEEEAVLRRYHRRVERDRSPEEMIKVFYKLAWEPVGRRSVDPANLVPGDPPSPRTPGDQVSKAVSLTRPFFLRSAEAPGTLTQLRKGAVMTCRRLNGIKPSLLSWKRRRMLNKVAKSLPDGSISPAVTCGSLNKRNRIAFRTSGSSMAAIRRLRAKTLELLKPDDRRHIEDVVSWGIAVAITALFCWTTFVYWPPWHHLQRFNLVYENFGGAVSPLGRTPNAHIASSK